MSMSKIRIGTGPVPKQLKNHIEAGESWEEIVCRCQGIRGPVYLAVYGEWWYKFHPLDLKSIVGTFLNNKKFQFKSFS